MGIFENIKKLKTVSAIYNRAVGDIPTRCIKCRNIETVKLLNDGISHSYKCDCGITIYRYHEPDNFHSKPFFLKTFISQREYIKDFKKEGIENGK